MKHISAPIILSLWLTMCQLWCGCSRDTGSKDNSNALYRAGDIEVFADSIIIGDITYTALSPAEITHCWKAPSGGSTDLDITFASSSHMADALFSKALSRYYHFPLSTADIYIHGALLDPQRAMESLRSMVADDGTIHRHGFPITADKEAWAAAAWEVYCATGSIPWLKEAYRVINRTIQRDTPVLDAGRNGLIPTWILQRIISRHGCHRSTGSRPYASAQTSGTMPPCPQLVKWRKSRIYIPKKNGNRRPKR